MAGKVKAILAELSGLELHEIQDDSELANLGIDSLMGMEMSREIENEFKCTLDPDRLIQVIDMPGLMQCVHAALPGSTAFEQEILNEEDSDEEDQRSSKVTSVFTPSDSDTNLSSVGETDVVDYLAEFLGLKRGDVSPEMVLRDLGVDSLLSTELRADFASKFDIEISEHVIIEELTVEELDAKVNGTAKSIKSPPAKDTANQREHSAVLNVTLPPLNLPSPVASGLKLPPLIVMEAFKETKALTDKFIGDHGCSDYAKIVLPKQTEMCIALTLETFEELGCSIRGAKIGEILPQIKYPNENKQLGMISEQHLL